MKNSNKTINVYYQQLLDLNKETLDCTLEITIHKNNKFHSYIFEGMPFRSEGWVKNYIKKVIPDISNDRIRLIKPTIKHYVPTILTALLSQNK